MTGFSIRQKCLQAAGLIVCIHHPLPPAQPLCASLPHSHWGGNLFWEADVPASSLQTSRCAVDELGAPGVFVFQLFTLSSIPFPGPTSHSVPTFCVLGLTIPFPASSSILECSISSDAPLTPTHLHTQTISYSRLTSFLPGQTSFQAPLPRASHRCSASFSLCSVSFRLRPSL